MLVQGIVAGGLLLPLLLIFHSPDSRDGCRFVPPLAASGAMLSFRLFVVEDVDVLLLIYSNAGEQKTMQEIRDFGRRVRVPFLLTDTLVAERLCVALFFF